MNVLIIGGGAMGQSIARGLKTNNADFNVYVVENNSERKNVLELEGVKVFNSVAVVDKEVFKKTDVILIAVKPNDFESAAKDIFANTKPTLILSIAAGVSTSSIESMLEGFPVVRAMPNLAVHVNESATAICAGMNAKNEHLDIARQILLAIGMVQVVDEEQMNLITALSGSGPAYFYLISEYLAKAAIELGLDEKTAKIFSEQTLIGAAKTLSEQSSSVEQLRGKVTSPGGTTEAAISNFEANELYKVVLSGVKAARDRAKELGK